MRRYSVLLLTILLVMSLLIGCAVQEPTKTEIDVPDAETPSQETEEMSEPEDEETQEVVQMKYVIPGELPDDEEKVFKIINEKLLEDGVGIQIVRECIPWDVWEQKINLKLSSGEEFDLFHIMQDWIPYTNYYGRDALADITDLIPEYGPEIVKRIPEEMFTGSQIKGRTYIIPTFWIELAVDTDIYYRKDVFEKYNLEIPKTPDDILECYKIVRADWDGVNKPILAWRPDFDPNPEKIFRLHRAYDDFPFVVKDQFFQVYQDGTVESWIESEAFKKDAAFMRKAYKEGIIHPDVLSANFDWINNYIAHGDVFLWKMADYNTCLKNNPDLKKTDRGKFRLNPEKPSIRSWSIKNCNGVPYTSKNPEAGIKFINWLWSNQENYDLYMCGIQGEHWNPDPNDERGVQIIKDPTTDSPRFFGDHWMIGYIDFVRYDATQWADEGERYVVDETAINSVAGVFFFDSKDVSTEYANCQAEAQAVLTPIYMGVQEYDEAFPEALERMKAAGIDKIVEEYQRQLTEFLESQK